MRYGASMVTVQADNNQASGVALHRHEEKKGAKNKRFWRIMNKVYFCFESKAGGISNPKQWIQ